MAAERIRCANLALLSCACREQEEAGPCDMFSHYPTAKTCQDDKVHEGPLKRHRLLFHSAIVTTRRSELNFRIANSGVSITQQAHDSSLPVHFALLSTPCAVD